MRGVQFTGLSNLPYLQCRRRRHSLGFNMLVQSWEDNINVALMKATNGEILHPPYSRLSFLNLI